MPKRLVTRTFLVSCLLTALDRVPLQSTSSANPMQVKSNCKCPNTHDGLRADFLCRTPMRLSALWAHNMFALVTAIIGCHQGFAQTPDAHQRLDREHSAIDIRCGPSRAIQDRRIRERFRSDVDRRGAADNVRNRDSARIVTSGPAKARKRMREGV